MSLTMKDSHFSPGTRTHLYLRFQSTLRTWPALEGLSQSLWIQSTPTLSAACSNRRQDLSAWCKTTPSCLRGERTELDLPCTLLGTVSAHARIISRMLKSATKKDFRDSVRLPPSATCTAGTKECLSLPELKSKRGTIKFLAVYLILLSQRFYSNLVSPSLLLRSKLSFQEK